MAKGAGAAAERAHGGRARLSAIAAWVPVAPWRASAEAGGLGIAMSPQIAWIALVTAGLLDVGWAIAMKYADGYTRLGWSIASLVLLAAFVFLLGRALQVLEIGVAYTVWTGIGAGGTLTMGVLLFGEALSPMKMAGIVLVMAGIVVLKIGTV